MIPAILLAGIGLTTLKRHRAEKTADHASKEAWIKRADALASERTALQTALAQECQHSIELQRVVREQGERCMQLESQLKDLRCSEARASQSLREIGEVIERMKR